MSFEEVAFCSCADVEELQVVVFVGGVDAQFAAGAESDAIDEKVAFDGIGCSLFGIDCDASILSCGDDGAVLHGEFVDIVEVFLSGFVEYFACFEIHQRDTSAFACGGEEFFIFAQYHVGKGAVFEMLSVDTVVVVEGVADHIVSECAEDEVFVVDKARFFDSQSLLGCDNRSQFAAFMKPDPTVSWWCCRDDECFAVVSVHAENLRTDPDTRVVLDRRYENLSGFFTYS